MLKTKRIEGMKIDDENSRKFERARILPVEEKAEHTSCFGRCRSSLNTATALGFIILFLDAMLLTALEPILPDIVRHLKGVPEFLQGEKYNEIMNDTVGNVTFFGPTPTSSLAVGIVFSAKPFMELMANPLVGCAVDKFGYEAPMHCGYFVSFISALGLAFSNSYLLLFISRCIQGIGNVLLVISTLAFLSHIHGDTPGRSAAFAVAFIGVGVGALVGFPYGGFVYEYVGREYPYLILGILIILAWCFRVWYKPTLYDKFQTQSNFFSYFKMCLDPYLLVAVVLWIAVSFSVSGLLVSVPLQAMDEYNERPFHIGILFLTSASVQIITQALLAKHTHKIGWWKVCFAGGLLQPCTFLLFVAMPSFWWLTFPMAIGGLSMGLFLSSFHALLCHITDVRFGPNYGAAFSLNKIGYGIGVFSGSVIFSILIHHYGYDTTFFVAAGITFVTSLGALFLRNVPNLYETELDDKAKE